MGSRFHCHLTHVILMEPSSEVGSYTSTKKERRGEEMKYIVFWEMCPEDFDKVIPKFQEVMEEREKGTDKFPKALSPNYSLGGQWKGFMLYEDATPEQLMNVVLHYQPLVKFKFIPILEAAKMIEIHLKSKK